MAGLVDSVRWAIQDGLGRLLLTGREAGPFTLGEQDADYEPGPPVPIDKRVALHDSSRASGGRFDHIDVFASRRGEHPPL